ncbi:SgcJ/EcaC family oxidoreductase [Burkholderia cenocepacia]|nr:MULTISPECIES: SgcJ/EcaC family oxidoreductase [Burkholderia]ARF90528.1 ketosteroid isomerase [Burkholderia cenocepacia]MCW3673404.1 SgcJ/EcaC family oxidoreductase [Burkholderia cenocepacia]MDA3666209.1 SgcJ/EcaC family oxidoreductase [Burkholderia cenocepacia]MDA3676152.1 SgcJ/EcaC family oxidoreductase [Burkholderia cenocepacia]MDA3683851.1 SgcJ/EcaC family oxidoreductase [Burkholderia cenocepacia]
MYKKLNTSVVSAVLALALVPVAASAAQPGSNRATTEAITSQLNRYEKALNTSNTDEVMKLYADDAIFMPQSFPAAIGQDNVRNAYDAIFRSIKLNVTFRIDEIKRLSSDWAFARTHSSGTQTVLATDKQSAEGNQEIFLFHRSKDGAWRFARYIFSTTNPPEPGSFPAEGISR